MKKPLPMGQRIIAIIFLGGLCEVLAVLGFLAYRQGKPGVSVMCGIIVAVVAKKAIDILFEKGNTIQENTASANQ